jgi:hypothetical protein
MRVYGYLSKSCSWGGYKLEKPGFKERIFTVRIEGTAPLLMHSPSGLGGEKKARGVIPSPEEEAESGLYRDGDGKIVVPARCVEGAIVKAAAAKTAAGQGKKTYKNFILAGVQATPEEIPLIYEGNYIIDKRRAVIMRQGIIRCRPRFDKWALEFDIRVIDAYLLGHGQEAMLRGIFEDAGSLVGLLDFRPRFGRFEVTKFVMKSEK